MSGVRGDSRSSILIADDEPGILDLLKWELENLGHEVRLASDGGEAIAQLRRAEFDVVVTDIRMPGANGIDVLKAAKQVAPDTEVVITTGFAEMEAAIECVRGGAFDFVQKPFDVNDLVATVARALERRRLRAATALYQASQAIFAAKEPQRLPEIIVDVAMNVMDADDVSLMVPGAEQRLIVLCSHGMSPELQADVHVALGERVAGRVAESREPALLQDGLAEDPRFADVPSFGRVRSSIVFPLYVADRLLGVLNFNRVRNEKPFRKQDLERASVLASQVSLALENARLVRQMVTSERLASVGQLASGVAHEINNPVAYILATHSFLREQQLGPLRKLNELFEQGAGLGELRAAWSAAGGHAFFDEYCQALDDIGEGAARIRDIVRDLRSLARSDEGTSALVDLNDVIRSALRVAGAEIRTRAVVTEQLGAHVGVQGNAGRLSQVFINLLVNAAQAIGERPGRPGKIVVSSERQGDSVLASVGDNGPGILPEHAARIFEAFFTTKGPAIGTGLGLSISREIVRSHGGEIWVEPSSPGQGATFTVRLRAAASPLATAAAPHEVRAPKECQGEKFRILFVDDEPSILRAYERTFGREHDVVTAGGGSQALAILTQRQDFNLVVCDLLMPDVNGMEIYRRSRKVHPELDDAFVFVTGAVTQGDVQSFLGTVGNQVLEKPFEMGALREIIDARKSCAGP